MTLVSARTDRARRDLAAMTSGWIENARAAKKLLAGKKHGEMERSLLDAAWKDANTARRAIAAVEYIDDLIRNRPEVSRALQDAPFSIVELLARWHSFDPEGASKKAIEWAQSKYGVRTLADALCKARKQDTVATTKEDVATLIRRSVKAPLIARLRNMLPGSLSEPVLNFKAPTSPPVDYRFEWFVDDGEVKIRTIAVLIVGPYGNNSLYAKRRFEWILRAFGLAWFFDRIFLVVPTEDLARQYSSWIRVCEGRAADLTANLRKPEVGALDLSQAGIERLTAKEQEAIATLGR
jgi:hypothetical protein